MEHHWYGKQPYKVHVSEHCCVKTAQRFGGNHHASARYSSPCDMAAGCEKSADEHALVYCVEHDRHVEMAPVGGVVARVLEVSKHRLQGIACRFKRREACSYACTDKKSGENG